MFERFDRSSKVAIPAAMEEARRRGERRVGTEHLLLGTLVAAGDELEPALGVGLDEVRAALTAMDAEALAAVGVDVGALALDWSPEEAVRRAGRQRLPFTAATRSALQRSLRLAAAEGSRQIRPRHLLLGVLGSSTPDPARDVLARLGVDEDAVRLRLRDAA